MPTARYERRLLLLCILSSAWCVFYQHLCIIAGTRSNYDDAPANELAGTRSNYDDAPANEQLFHSDFGSFFDARYPDATNEQLFHSDFGSFFDARYPDATDSPPAEETWLLSPSRNRPSSNEGGIPRRVNKIYFQKDGRASPLAGEAVRDAHKSWPDLNPGYDVRYFDLIGARGYLRAHFHPAFLRTFDCIEAFAGKSDFFRAALLYREGGFHSDFKQVCLRPGLLDDIRSKTNFFVALDVGSPFVRRFPRRCVQNAFIGSTPRHAILVKYLEVAMRNVQFSIYPPNALQATGPCALGEAVITVDGDFGRHTADDGRSTPIHANGMYTWEGEGIVLSKCSGCGEGQNWENGNNYYKLFRERRYYCEDSVSVFAPDGAVGENGSGGAVAKKPPQWWPSQAGGVHRCVYGDEYPDEYIAKLVFDSEDECCAMFKVCQSEAVPNKSPSIG